MVGLYGGALLSPHTKTHSATPHECCSTPHHRGFLRQDFRKGHKTVCYYGDNIPHQNTMSGVFTRVSCAGAPFRSGRRCCCYCYCCCCNGGRPGVSRIATAVPHLRRRSVRKKLSVCGPLVPLSSLRPYCCTVLRVVFATKKYVEVLLAGAVLHTSVAATRRRLKNRRDGTKEVRCMGGGGGGGRVRIMKAQQRGLLQSNHRIFFQGWPVCKESCVMEYYSVCLHCWDIHLNTPYYYFTACTLCSLT